MFRTSTRTIAAVAAITLLTSSGSLFARAKEGHGKGKKDPHTIQIGPGGGLPHPGAGDVRMDRLSSLTPRPEGRHPRKAERGEDTKTALALPTVILEFTPQTNPGSITPGGPHFSVPRKFANAKDRNVLDVEIATLQPGGSIEAGDGIDASDANRSGEMSAASTVLASAPAAFASRPMSRSAMRFVGARSIVGAGPIVTSPEPSQALLLDLDAGAALERPSLRIPRLLDHASFAVSRDGESGLAADGAWSFQF